MAAIQKLKLFASHCGVARSPTQSPRPSPIVQLRRPKTTLRTLLSLNLSRSGLAQEAPLLQEHNHHHHHHVRRHSLKDLFVSSPPREVEEEMGRAATGRITTVSVLGSNMGLGGPGNWSDGSGSSNPVWRGFRCRSLLKRKAWRPLLITIPECN